MSDEIWPHRMQFSEDSFMQDSVMLERLAMQAYGQGDRALGAALAQAAGLYAIAGAIGQSREP
jgi:hypothetical protein